MTNVVAGVMLRDGEVFAGRRRADQAHALKWEFPGGKIEAGETPEAALARELEEELGIVAQVGRELMRYEFAYPEKKPILLIFLEVTAWNGIIENRVFAEIAWTRATELSKLDFLEGDAPFLAVYRPAIENVTPRA